MLEGKRALVTGANDGIGRAIAESFAREGALVAAHGRNQQRIESTLAAIEGAGGKAFGVCADLRDAEAVRAMCADALARLGGIDVIVNNAGVGSCGPFLEADPDREITQIDLNIGALTDLTRHLLPGMVARGRGHILQTAESAVHARSAGGTPPRGCSTPCC